LHACDGLGVKEGVAEGDAETLGLAATDFDALGAAEVGLCHDGVAVANNLEVACGFECGFDGIGERLFVARNRFDIADLAGEFDHIRVSVES
jgi:hypothetical protein